MGINLDNAEPTTCVNRIIAERVAGERRVAVAVAADAPTRDARGLMARSRIGSRLWRDAHAAVRAAGGGVSQAVAAHGPGRDAGGGGGARPRLTVKGITKTGYLLAVDAAGARYELHPDGNSLDFFKGLVRKKMQS